MSRTAGKILFFLFALSPIMSVAQNLSGIWRGYFKTEDGYEYRCEIQISQNKSKSVTGVSYSYLDTRFYGKATLTGMFNANAKTIMVQEIKTVELKMDAGSVACIMKYLMSYSKSGKEEFLEGTFTSKYEKDDGYHKKGDPAGGGTVFLRKVTTSDFYVEPFLRNKPKTDAVTKKPATTQSKPQNNPKPKPQNKPVTTNRQPANRQPNTVTANTPKKDTVKRRTDPIIIDKPKTTPNTISIPVTTRSRENELVQTVKVSSEQISIRLYDNGEIDGDTISVYLDGRPVVSNQGLSTKPIVLNLKMDESNPEHVLVMVAENLGRIPPNTSLMIVQDGDKRYQVSITSTVQKNAMVRFRYQKN